MLCINSTLHCTLWPIVFASVQLLPECFTKVVVSSVASGHLRQRVCLQIMLLLRQMEATGTQALMSKVSLLTIGQQAIMDAYLCLLHLTTGVPVVLMIALCSGALPSNDCCAALHTLSVTHKSQQWCSPLLCPILVLATGNRLLCMTW